MKCRACTGSIGRLITITAVDGRRHRVLEMLGRWRYEDGAWRASGRERRTFDTTGMSPWFLNPPASVVCPHCGEVQPMSGVEAVDIKTVGPGLSRVAVRG